MENPVIEPFAVLDTFITGHGRIELLPGSNMRVSLIVHQASAHDASVERILVAKLAGSRDCLEQFAIAILNATGSKAPTISTHDTLSRVQ